MSHSVMLDTSFCIRLLNSEDPLHLNAKNYFKYFLEHDYILKLSTIAVAEYCVRGSIKDLPLEKVQIIPFNIDHAERAGKFAGIVYNKNSNSDIKLKPRTIIPNDTKLFAQADLDALVTHFVTCDLECQKTFNILKAETKVNFDIIDFNIPYNEVFGKLDLNFES
jgi:predicted nucleic acid-binding protein